MRKIRPPGIGGHCFTKDGLVGEIITKRDLVVRIVAKIGLSQQQVTAIIQKILDYITESLVAGGNIEFRDFGIFEVITRKSLLGRNPRKPGDSVVIPARRVVKFKAGKKMKARVLKG